MRYILRIQLSGFYTRAIREQGNLSPCLVVHRDKAVLCADDEAMRRGVLSGTSLPEAKAILRDGAFVEWSEEPFASAQEAWLDLCCEFTDVVEPDMQHAAFLDLSGHPDPVDIAFQISREIERRLGYPTAIGLASTQWIARLACQPYSSSSIGNSLQLEEPVMDPAGFLAGLPVSNLLPVPGEQRERLLFLGYSTIGSVTSLSLATLKRHFGEDGLRIHQAAWGGCAEPVVPEYPKDAVQDTVRFEGAIDCLEAFDRGLRQLSSRLSEKLSSRDSQGHQLELWVESPESGTEKVSRTFSRPMQSVHAILSGLRILSATLANGPVLSIRAHMRNLSAADRGQRSLTGNTASQSTAAERAIACVREAFGESSVKAGFQMEPPRRDLVLRAWKDATGWR